jgi:hypothetical protein
MTVMAEERPPLGKEPAMPKDLVPETSPGVDPRRALSNCRDWYASHDHQPPGPTRLTVTGMCTFPTTGYTAELQPLEPQGINPKELLMKLVVHEPEVGGDALTDVEVRFQMETDMEYETVTIISVETLSSGSPSIPVQDVH